MATEEGESQREESVQETRGERRRRRCGAGAAGAEEESVAEAGVRRPSQRCWEPHRDDEESL